MKIAITGAAGALGEAVRVRAQEAGHQVFPYGHGDVDITHDASIMRALGSDKPNVVINCAGVIDRNAPRSRLIDVNARGPLILAAHCAVAGIPLIHVSTDCVFSGSRPMFASEYNGPHGPYPSSEQPDASYSDTYASTKAMGEVHDAIVTNVRTSFLTPRHGLVKWLRHEARAGRQVEGYMSVWWNGSSAWHVAGALVEMAADQPGGTVHLATEPVTKFAVLQRIAEVYGLPVHLIEPVWEPVRNFTLAPDIELVPLDGTLAWPA